MLGSKTLFLWSGSVAVARAIISAAREESGDGGEQIELFTLLNRTGLSSDELKTTAVIYHFVDDGRLHVDSHNADIAHYGEQRVRYSGSGSFDFVLDNDVQGSGWENPVRFRQSWIGRALYSTLLESLSTHTLDYLYGGWIELIEPMNGAFAKIPYAVKFWRARLDGSLGVDEPFAFSFYQGHQLYVCSAQMEERADDIRLLSVPDFLGRHADPLDAEAALPWQPRFTCHIILQHAASLFKLFIQHEGESSMRMVVYPNGDMDMEFPAALIEQLLVAQSSDEFPALLLKKASGII